MKNNPTKTVMREQVYIVLNDIIRDVLGDERLGVDDATITGHLPGWDSLAQIDVLAAVEIRFGIEIQAGEAERLLCVGDLVDLILRKAPRLCVA